MSRADWLPEEGGGRVTAIKGFRIQDAYFATDPNYAEGVYLLHWVGVDEEGNEYNAEGFHPSWPAPNGFVSLDSGKSIRHPEGYKLRNNGWLGRMAKIMFEVTAGANPDPLDNFSPLEATGYIGMVFDLEELEVNYGSNIGVKSRLMPSVYRGLAGAAAAAANSDGLSIDDKVLNLAQAAGSFEEFRSAALSIPGVSANGALVSQIVDQASGIWAKVKG